MTDTSPLNIIQASSVTVRPIAGLTDPNHDGFTTVQEELEQLAARSGPATGMSNLTPTRDLGLLNHVGPPVAADGTFTYGDKCHDISGQQWLCLGSGSPGSWTAVGSGKVIGSVRLAAQYTMAVAGATEDVAGAFFPFTFDGRPVMFGTTPLATSLTTAGAAKVIQLIIRRSSDNAVVGNAYREQETSLSGQIQPHFVEAGPFTAWPSDNVPFVVGQSYQVKLSINASPGFLASTNGNTQPYSVYAKTA